MGSFSILGSGKTASCQSCAADCISPTSLCPSGSYYDSSQQACLVCNSACGALKVASSCGVPSQGAGLSSSCVCDFTASETGPYQLNVSDIQPAELFGFAVRIDSVVTSDFSSPGPLAFVGAPGYDSRRGRVHVFSRNSASGCLSCPTSFCTASWNRMTTISYAGALSGDHFGSAIALARSQNQNKLLAIVAISAPLANQTGRVFIFMQSANKVSFSVLQVLAPDAAVGKCGSLCRTKPLFGTSMAISQDFLAVGCPLCLTTRGTSGGVYLYRWQSSSSRYQRVQLLRSETSDMATGLLISSSLLLPSAHEGSSFGSSLSMHVSNGGTLTLAVAAMHCNYETSDYNVISAGAVFIFSAETGIPYGGQLDVSLFQRQVVSAMTVGFSMPQAEFSLGRSVSISIDGKFMGICGGVGFCESFFMFGRAGPLTFFAYKTVQDFRALNESTLYQSFHTASVSQDQVGIVGNPFYDGASGAVFMSKPQHLGFRGNARDPAVSEDIVNFDFEIRSPWLHFFYGTPNYNTTYFY